MALTIRIESFSFKKGYPQDPSGNGGGHVFDCRIIPNPGVLDQYKALTGMDKPVADYLQEQVQTSVFIAACKSVIDLSLERYLERNFTHLMIGFGCTGGQHRSVYFTEYFANYIKNSYSDVIVIIQHREQNVYKEL